MGDQIKAKIAKISAEHIARTESQRPVSPTSRQYSVQLGSIAGNLESVQRISGLSPSPRGSAAGIPETNRENDQEEDQRVQLDKESLCFHKASNGADDNNHLDCNKDAHVSESYNVHDFGQSLVRLSC